MGQKDYVAPTKTIEQHAIIDLNEFIKQLHSIIKERGYPTLMEQSHKESNSDSGRNVSFYWYAVKKPSNYVKIYLEVIFSANVKNVSIEKDEAKHTMQEGTLSVSLTGYIMKDYEDEWAIKAQSPTRKLLREFYDKFVGRDRIADNENELNNDIKLVIGELKTYLKMSRVD
ncbi:MAG: hypothetical protein V1906_02680 [Candidatus Woesearchaeota archaeon]